MELTENQREQQRQCQNEDCDCGTPTTQEEWKVRMEHQGWMDFGIDFDFWNKVHEDDKDYDRGHQNAYDNR